MVFLVYVSRPLVYWFAIHSNPRASNIEDQRFVKRARNVNKNRRHSPLTKNRNNFVTTANVYLAGSTRIVYTRKGPKPLAASPRPGSELPKLSRRGRVCQALVFIEGRLSPSRRCSLDSLQRQSEIRNPKSEEEHET